MRHAVSVDELTRRVIACNKALEFISCKSYPPIWLKFKGFRAFVCWEYHGEKCFQWVTRAGNDFYPTWQKGPWGGTTNTALSQLIRWCQGKPVLPLGCFEYWCGQGVMLAGDKGPECIALLRESGYPAEVTCVVCGEKPNGIDWWSRDGVNGPCCRRADLCSREMVSLSDWIQTPTPPCRVCGKTESIISYPDDHSQTVCPDCCDGTEHADGESGHVWTHDNSVRGKVCDHCGIERRCTKYAWED